MIIFHLSLQYYGNMHFYMLFILLIYGLVKIYVELFQSG